MAQMLTVEQAAKKMQMSPRLLRVFLRTGKLRGYKVGRTWRVQETDIAQYTTDYHEPVAAERVSAYGICSDIEGWSTDEFMKAKQTEIELEQNRLHR